VSAPLLSVLVTAAVLSALPWGSRVEEDSEPAVVKAVRTGANYTSGGLDPGPWPTRGHDNRRTNQGHFPGPAYPGPPVLLFDARSAEHRARFGFEAREDWLVEDLVVTSDGKLLLGSCGDALVALSTVGEVLWQRPLRGPAYSHSPVGITVDLTGGIHVATHECPDIHGPIDTARYRLWPSGEVEQVHPHPATSRGPAIGPDGTV
jgi:hypothetical protein